MGYHWFVTPFKTPPISDLIVARSLQCVLFGLVVAVLSSPALAESSSPRPYRPTTTIRGLTYCAKHHIPTISVIAYHSINTRDRLVLVHDWSPQAMKCTDLYPNRLADDSRLSRTSIHSMRGRITFCARCSWEYYHCKGGNRRLTDSDIQQITSLALDEPRFRKPILHIFAVYSPNAIAVGGGEGHVGDVFTDIGLEKRRGRWSITSPASSHRIVAVGRAGPF
ncbi:MAG: hypothetical protein QOI49_1297 [Verrucomicrobiota bacterium]